jgi:catechol 2,3-dioxygenase-like lactoylglutathione lyase family enzyme
MTQTATTFHLSLNVSNLARSVAFYRVLFGLEPAKQHDDYAKFELTEPPVIFSLVPQASLATGSVSRIGLRLPDTDAVAAVKQRLDAAGIATQAPCSGNSATKCYVADPDLTYWEITTGDDDGPAVELPRPVETTASSSPGPVVWEHYITGPVQERIPHADHTVDEVRLTGTFNAVLPDGALTALLGEVRRILKPGGPVIVHGLVGDRPFAQPPQLPGLAALVQRVPQQGEPVEALQAAGFVGLHFIKFSEKAWFCIDGVELREMKLIAYQPASADGPVQVLYPGPFAEAIDDCGNVYPRGRTVMVSAERAAALRRGAVADQFLFPAPAGGTGSTCSIRG